MFHCPFPLTYARASFCRKHPWPDPVRRGIRRRLPTLVVRLRRPWLVSVLRQRAHRPVLVPRVHLRQVSVVHLHADRVALLQRPSEALLAAEHGHGRGSHSTGHRTGSGRRRREACAVERHRAGAGSRRGELAEKRRRAAPPGGTGSGERRTEDGATQRQGGGRQVKTRRVLKLTNCFFRFRLFCLVVAPGKFERSYLLCELGDFVRISIGVVRVNLSRGLNQLIIILFGNQY